MIKKIKYMFFLLRCKRFYVIVFVKYKDVQFQAMKLYEIYQNLYYLVVFHVASFYVVLRVSNNKGGKIK